jgi:hypothetical protein
MSSSRSMDRSRSRNRRWKRSSCRFRSWRREGDGVLVEQIFELEQYQDQEQYMRTLSRSCS